MFDSRLARTIAVMAAVGLAACGSSDPGGSNCSPTDPACNPGDTTTTPTPLTVASVSPVNGASDVEPNATVTVTFSAAVDPASVTASSVNLGSAAGTLSVLGSVVTLEPDADLSFGSTYSLSVNGVTGADGGFMSSAFSSSFTTKEAPIAANAGADMAVSAGGTVVLDGSQSSGSSIVWTQIEGPDVGTLTGASPTFTPPAGVTVLAFEVSASNGGATSEADTLRMWVLEDGEHALWVSPSGSPSNPGTREAPLSSIQDAIDVADNAGFGADVYIASGTYDESITLRSRVSLYGGFDDSDWSRDVATHRPVVRGGETAFFGQSSNALTVEGLEIIAADATSGDGASSIAIHLVDSDGVAIWNNVIAAGTGRTGGTGSPGTPPTAGPDVGSNGADAGTCSSPGGAGGSGYPGYNGGRGANGGLFGGFAGDAGQNADLFDGQGGSAGSNGGTGKAGSAGAAGAAGDAFGAVSGTGYTGAAGGRGGKGGVGGGGGGGGSGGGNGVGGCGGGGGGGGEGGDGGSGGYGGAGGGGSIGVLLVGLTVADIVQNDITTAVAGDGGTGGRGGNGQDGARGGYGGDPAFTLGDGGNGGTGGKGGGGGGGAGGAGGPSIGIVEDAPATLTRTGNAFTLGTRGAGGAGGAGGSGGGIFGGGRTGDPGPAGEQAEHKKIS